MALSLAKVQQLVRHGGELALSLVAPHRCVFCGVHSEADERAVCKGCFDDLPWIEHSCPLCAESLPTSSGVACPKCQAAPPPVETTVAPLAYEFPLDAAIKRFKFHRQLHFVPALVELLLTSANRLPADIDALLPVPLHPYRHLRRGYNQAAELAKPLGKAFELPVLSNVRRIANTPPQSGLSAAARRRNLRNAFVVRGRIQSQHVVIVDDVVTTGATCQQLAHVLLAAGARKVSVLAIARA